MADRYWVGGTGTWNTLSTTNWSTTSGGASGASVPTAADSVFFDQAGTYTVTCVGGPLPCLDLTVSAGAVTFLGSTNHTVSGSISLVSATVWSVGGIITSSVSAGTKTIQTNGVSISGFTVSGAGVRQLLGALTVRGTFTHSSGTLDLNTYTLSFTGYSSTLGTRAIAFNGGNMTLTGAFTGTGTLSVWNSDYSSGFSYTGTPTVNIANTTVAGKGIALTIIAGASTALDFNFTSGAYDLIENGSPSNYYRNLNFTGFSGNVFNYTRFIFGGFNAGLTAVYSAGTNLTTFGATSGTWDITSNSYTLDFPITFNGLGGTWQLSGAMTIGSTRTTTLTNGTLNLSSQTFSTGLFNRGGGTIGFGTGQITLSGNGATIWTGSVGTVTGTFKVVATYTGGTGTRTLSTTATETTAQPLSTSGSSGFILDTSSTDTKSLSGSWGNIDLTAVTGTLANSAITVFGSYNAGSTVTLTAGASATTFAATSGIKTINSNGRTLDFPFTFNGVGGAWQLQGALTSGSARTTTLTAGSLDLNGFTHTTGLFSSSNSNVRSIAFGAGNITLIGSGTVWNTATLTNFSDSGTPTINVSNNSATATTVTTGTPTEAQALDFNYTTGTYILTDTSAVYRSVNLTGFVGTFANNARTYFGGFNAGSTATLTAGVNVQTFSATSSTWLITRNGRTLDFPFTFNGIGGTWQLQDNFSVGVLRAFTLTNGTIDINSQTASVGVFTLPASTSRAIANGVLTCASVTHTAGSFAVGSAYNISTPGTYTFTAGALTINDGATLPVGAFSSSNSNVRSIAFGTGQISLSGNATTIWDNSTITNFSFTGTFKVFATYTGGTGTRALAQGFASEAAVQSISTTGSSGFILDTSSTDTKNLAGSWNDIDLTGVTGVLANAGRAIYGNFNAGSTVILTAGANTTTFLGTLGVDTITSNGRVIDFPLTFNGTGGTWQLQDALTLGVSRTATLTAGSINLNGFTLTTGRFSSSNSNVRSIAFGTGSITLIGNGAVWSTAVLTNFSDSGTPTINVSNNSATATTVTTGAATEAQALDFNYTTGTYVLTDTSAVYRSLNLTGFAGTFPNISRRYFGGFNAGSTATMTAGTTSQTFSATSGVWGITSNGRTLDFSLGFDGAGGTWQLQDALTIGNRSISLFGGTFDANNYNVTLGLMTSSNSGVRTLSLGSGTWTVAGTGPVAWNFFTSTNATIIGTATISMTGATAKTFAGGGLTWPTLNQGGSGALTISENNTFANITSTQTATGPCAITFTAGSTQSVSNFTASGTAIGQLTLGSTTTSPYNLIKLGGGDVNVSFCTISYSNASP